MDFILKHKKLLLIIMSAVFIVSSAFTIIYFIWEAMGKKDAYLSVRITYASANAYDYISPSNIASDGEYAYISDSTLNTVYKLKLNDNSIEKVYSSSSQVNSVAIYNDYVYVLEGARAGRVVKLDKNFKHIETVDTDHTPVDMVIIEDRAYVANRFSNNVSVFSVNENAMTILDTIDVGREPNSLVVGANNKLYVSSHLPDGAANQDVMTSSIYVVDTELLEVTDIIPMLNGIGSVKDMCLSTSGDYLYVTAVISRYTFPTTQLDRGWINTNGIIIIDTATDEVLTGVLLDDVNLGAPNPWGIAAYQDKVVVALSGSNELVIIDETAMRAVISEVVSGNNKYAKSVGDIVNHFAVMNNVKYRVQLDGEGARAIMINDGIVYVGMYFSGIIAKYDIENDSDEYIALGNSVNPYEVGDTIRMGEILWYDATECYQQWESCASCHPDARSDGFNWDNLNDGLGNPKQTKSMLYSHRTPPVMVTGARDSAELAVEKGMNFIQFNTMDQTRLDYINDYLRSLVPETSPYLNRDGTLTESAERGKELFNSLSCVDCHPAPNYTDMKLHMSNKTLATGDDWEYRKFDTPTFVEIWRTAPYLFNGSAATMEDAVRLFVENYDLSEQEIKDLTEYILSIGNEGESYGVEQVFFRYDNRIVINSLYDNSEMYKLTIRKQNATVGNAHVTIAIYNELGEMIGEKLSAELKNMEYNELATLRFSIDIEIEDEVSYYLITIKSTDGSTNYATDYKVYTKEAR